LGRVLIPVDQGRLFADGIKQFERWRSTRAPADLESAIASLAELDAAVPDDPGVRFWAGLLHAMALGDRYELNNSVDDIDGVIGRLKRVVACPDPLVGDDDMDTYRVALGRALANRIDMYGRPGGPPPVGDAEFLAELQTAVDALAVAAAATSELVTPAERAEAAALRAHLIPKLLLTQGIVGRKAGRLADIAELERVLRDLPIDYPNRAQLILELGLAHMHLVLRPGAGAASPSSPWSDHRVPAVQYLSAAVELLDPGYPERAKAIAFLAYLSLTRRPDSPDAAAGSARELTAQALAAPGLDPNVGAVLHLLAGMTANPGSPLGDLAASVSHLSQALGLVGNLGKTDRAAGFMKAMPTAIAGVFRSLLSNPFASSPSLDDQDVADVLGHLSERGLLAEVAAEMPELARVAQLAAPPLRSGQQAGERLNAAFLAGDLAGVDAALADLELHLAELGPGHEFRWLLIGLIGSGWQARGALSGLTEDKVRGLETLVDAMDRAAACQPLTQLVDGAQWTARQRAAAAAAELGRLTRDPRTLTAALRRIAQLRSAPGLTTDGRADLFREHGMALLWRHELTPDAGDLDRAISELREARRIAGDDAGYGLLQGLSFACWTRGDRAKRDQESAIEAGLRALRQRGAGVLLQSGATQGLRIARAHRPDAAIQLVGWCLAEGRTDLAVEALELNRALVLHAATVTTDLPGLLRLAGHDSLADEWQAEIAAGPGQADGLFALLGPGATGQSPGGEDAQPPLRIPSLLRRRVLGALSETSAGAQLLAVPGPAELGSALRLADADAFVYLIPSHREGGCALLVGADDSIEHIALPGLSDTALLDAHDAAYREATRSRWEASERLAWQQTLEALCDWAWDAATGPVLRWLARRLPGQPGRAARVVLIPVGRLGAVPWHAARRVDEDGRRHYAIEDAVFSYAASAGQFARASRRQGRPWAAAPLLLSDPTNELGWAQLEVAELKHRYYPDADFLGLPTDLADGPGTPDEVLSRLPGGHAPPASLVHCGCHADVAPSLADSHLLLAEGRLLTIAEILVQARRHDPASPGFLAVLSACMTDLAQVDHDEALTLASALLAAGACAVIGARWPAEDSTTAPLMVMFHHFLNNGHPHPADALRAAQLWMLDSARTPLTDLPPGLANAFRLGPFLSAPHAWAAFTCQGASAGSPG
jgi:tetratricopeptide (TPR) repeat protein